MSKTVWSPEQEQAIRARGSSLLVAAAAGAGKTTVLVERIINYIKDPLQPVDVDRLLVVTYTNAAAAQMRERISRELARELNDHPDSRHLQRQLALLNHAAITTLHSFCLEVLRRHFYRLEMDPGFRVADEGETGLLQVEVLEQLLEDKYQDENEAFFRLVDAYGGERDDAGLVNIILKLYRFARSNPWPEDWLRRAVQALVPPVSGSVDDFPWCRGLKNSLALQVEQSCRELHQARELCTRPGGPGSYLEQLTGELAMLEGLARVCQGPWAGLFDFIQGISFARLKAVRSSEEVDPVLRDQARALREGVKKRLDSLRRVYFSQPPQQQLEDLRQLAPIIAVLVELVLEFGESYRRAKNSRGIVDFSDLEHYCLQILLQEGAQPGQLLASSVARELQEYYIEILVDEYQDINAVQEAILQLVSRQHRGARNLFMVGDVKQSIYRLRLAEPGLFMDKYQRYPVEEGGAERRINLKANYRSRRSIVDAVNYVFSHIMTPHVGEMAYDAEAQLVCGFDNPPAPDELCLPGEKTGVYLIDRHQEEPGPREDGEEAEGLDAEEDRAEEVLDTAQLEARLTGRLIRKLIEDRSCIWDGAAGKYRPLGYRDIAVLMRTSRGTANVFMDELRQAGIPAYTELGTGYFEAGEVGTILSLLQVIDNPCQDIPLITVLRSPLVGLNAEELACIRCCQPGTFFYRAVIVALSSLEGEAGHRLQAFFKQLQRWRTMARQERLTTLLWDIYQETHYYDYVGGMPGGPQRQANLRLLQAWAEKYEATAFRGLFHFLRFVERMRESGNDMGAARALSENEDVVQIMSIHKSKGLEFPVVILTGLARQFNFKDLQETVLTHKDLGIGPQFVDTALSISYPTLPKLALQQRIRLETLAEEMRLLYVAMTRAREQLFLLGTVRDLARQAEQWCQLAQNSQTVLSDGALAAARSFMDWVGPVLAGHPDGKLLWQKAGHQTAGPSDSPGGAQFELHVLAAGEAGQPVVDFTLEEKSLFNNIKQGISIEAGGAETEVDHRLSWQYPYPEVPTKGAKLTVTEIKNLFDKLRAEEEAEVLNLPNFAGQPRFIQEAIGLTAAERGSAVHLLLQHLELQGPLSAEAISEQAARLVEKEILTPAQAEVIDGNAIAGFFAGELGQRILKAGEVMREVPFSLAFPAGQVYPEIAEASPEQVMVQGVIDCLALEDEGFLLIDYKTDWLGPGRLSELVQRYRWQMQLYTRAVETILKKPVKEKYLYFMSAGIAIKIE